MVQRCHGSMTRWCDDEARWVQRCVGAMTQWRWRDGATVRWLWCNDVVHVVWWRWRDSAMVMVRWRDDTMVREVTYAKTVKRCFVVSSSRSALSRHLIALSRFLYSCAVCKKIMASDMLIFIRQILDRVLSIPEKFIILTYCCRIIKMFQLLFIFPRSYKSEKDGLVNEVNYLNPNQQTL